MKINHKIFLISAIILLAVTAFWVYDDYKVGNKSPDFEVTEEVPPLQEPEEEYDQSPIPPPPQQGVEVEEDVTKDLPHDKLFITVERQKYKSGELTLIIPKLSKELPIYDGVGLDVLAKGVGLYDYAQLPGIGNRNVSIAGHRNGRVNGKVTDKAPFYYVDTLAEGDYMYLRDDKTIYRYLFEEQKIVEEDDWGPIYSKGFSCLTLTTCHPIGISTERMIVTGRLDEKFPYDKDFDYKVSAKEGE